MPRGQHMVEKADYEWKGLTCQHCGKEFDSKSRNKEQKYCSKSCAAKATSDDSKFEEGYTPWNKGDTGEESHMYGRSRSKKTRERISEALKGENGGNWKGGVSRVNELLRKRKEYDEWRQQVFERDNYTCQDCGARSQEGQRVRLHAHHIIPLAQDRSKAYDVDNGVTLCTSCHEDRHSDRNLNLTGQTAERIKPDSQGDE